MWDASVPATLPNGDANLFGYSNAKIRDKYPHGDGCAACDTARAYDDTNTFARERANGECIHPDCYAVRPHASHLTDEEADQERG